MSAVAVTPRRAGLRAHLRTTPGRLHLALVVLFLAPPLVWLAAARGVARTQQAIRTISQDAAPSIVAADAAHADLAGMDANAANGFLGSGAEQHERQAYEAERQDADVQLLAAARNITYGSAESVPIQTMNTELQVYVGLVESARALGPARGRPLLLQASDLMHATILPAADRLRAVNNDHLQGEYRQIQADIGRARAALLGAGGVALAALLGVQIYLSVRTRRTFNLPLVLATLTLLLFVSRLSAVLVAEQADLKLLKEDSFDSVNALWGAKATAEEAHGYESLSLLAPDPQTEQRYGQAFSEQCRLLADAPITAQTVTDAAQAIRPMPPSQQIADANPTAVSFRGDIADELNNVTFPGEREAALAMLAGYRSYMDIDGEIRALQQGGRRQAAVELCIGDRPGQADYAFNRFDAALDRTLGINRAHFEGAAAQARAGLRGFTVFPPIAACLLLALAWLGLRPRLQEYHG